MKDYIVRAMDKGGNIRVFVASTTNLVEEARQTHNTAPTATAALGRTLTAASLMGNTLKNDSDTISLQIMGSALIKNVLAVSNNKGEVKGYISNPNANPPLKRKGKLDVGAAIGEGKLIVIRDLGLREPYIGQSDLVSGEIAEDLTNYFVYSEQQPSAVALGVLVDVDLSVRAAGGYIIQILPNADEEIISKLEQRLSNVEPVSTLIDKKYSPEDILEYICDGIEMKITETKDLKLVCDCSTDRIEKVLISMGERELTDIIEEDGEAEVVCHFCNHKYKFNKEELIKILEQAKI
ncbi:33 kDa chaperonin [Gottschalkia acidurici 9a]|uniref:33 kDa chaperonin n=1 Tax=Gottschalkia acidurici (strain ATCC 7906 / DSM 604 / BCRC 14475 / CIP 104303 / KCTC 5404 / NCIMB 10678 / 9a) TaxID=1128398 RepID=K0AXN0_GOTA9|nr:Hsp33 family molecular chaperone HslO [Gottschalkia acidurici]AFS77919.1 33 kDa chaperonin [Gottschalkia acidurici 9a]